MIKDTISQFCVIFGFITIMPFLFLCMPGNRWHDGTIAHQIVFTSYWLGSIILLVLFYKKKMKLNPAELLIGIVFGPCILVAIWYRYIVIKKILKI